MNTISQTDALLQDASNEVSRFLHQYKVSDILKQCNAYKQKGYFVIQLFAFLVTLMFQPMSTYMAMRVGAYKEKFSKNTIRRFCNNPAIYWHKFLRIFSQKLVSEFMRPATSDKREEFFIIDDTPFQKSGKKTELVSKFFDHVSMKYKFGYRILTLLWTDGYPMSLWILPRCLPGTISFSWQMRNLTTDEPSPERYANKPVLRHLN